MPVQNPHPPTQSAKIGGNDLRTPREKTEKPVAVQDPWTKEVVWVTRQNATDLKWHGTYDQRVPEKDRTVKKRWKAVLYEGEDETTVVLPKPLGPADKVTEVAPAPTAPTEVSEGMKELNALRADAEALGVTVDASWGKSKLTEVIEDATASK